MFGDGEFGNAVTLLGITEVGLAEVTGRPSSAVTAPL